MVNFSESLIQLHVAPNVILESESDEMGANEMITGRIIKVTMELHKQDRLLLFF